MSSGGGLRQAGIAPPLPAILRGISGLWAEGRGWGGCGEARGCLAVGKRADSDVYRALFPFHTVAADAVAVLSCPLTTPQLTQFPGQPGRVIAAADTVL